MAAAATLRFSRSFCFPLPCWGTVHNLRLLPSSWTSLCLWQEWGCQETGTRVRGNNKILNLDKVVMSQMTEEFLPVSGFVQLLSQGFWERRKKKCCLLFITPDKHKVILWNFYSAAYGYHQHSKLPSQEISTRLMNTHLRMVLKLKAEQSWFSPGRRTQSEPSSQSQAGLTARGAELQRQA